MRQGGQMGWWVHQSQPVVWSSMWGGVTTYDEGRAEVAPARPSDAHRTPRTRRRTPSRLHGGCRSRSCECVTVAWHQRDPSGQSLRNQPPPALTSARTVAPLLSFRVAERKERPMKRSQPARSPHPVAHPGATTLLRALDELDAVDEVLRAMPAIRRVVVAPLQPESQRHRSCQHSAEGVEEFMMSAIGVRLRNVRGMLGTLLRGGGRSGQRLTTGDGLIRPARVVRGDRKASADRSPAVT